MNFKHWLINEELVKNKEGRVYDELRGRYMPREYPVYKNPSPHELQNVFRVRADRNYAGGLLTRDDDVYIWPRSYAQHDSIIEDLGLSWDALHFYVYKDMKMDAYDEERWPDWQKSPNIQIMMGKPEEIEKAG